MLLCTAYQIRCQVVIPVMVRRTIRQIAGYHFAAENVRLPLESAGKLAEDKPEVQPHQADSSTSPWNAYNDNRR